jgi:hypothetical protein
MATALLLVAAVEVDARAEPVQSLGCLERESLEQALTQLGLITDPRPQGNFIGRVYIVNQDVFSRRDWRLQFLNIFHRTTRSDIVGRELLLSPGQRWDESLADELQDATRNNLRDTGEYCLALAFAQFCLEGFQILAEGHCPRMISTKTVFCDLDRASEQRFGLSWAICVSQQTCQVVESNSHIWMIRTEALLADSEGTLIQRLGLR